MRTIIAGSRNASFNDTVRALDLSNMITWISVVISGTASGPDTHGEIIAEQLGIPIERYPANWDKYGKSAGYKRNKQMAECSDALILVWNGTSNGSKNMLDIARSKGLDVVVYNTLTKQLM